MAALPAQQHPAAAPAIQKENALLPRLQIPLQLPPELRPNEAGIPDLDFLAKIGDKDLGQASFIVPAAELRLVVLPRLRCPGRLNGRRG